MENFQIPYKNTGYFSKTMLDYIAQKEDIQQFYHRFPTLINFKGQIKEKEAHFPKENRAVLVNAIQQQYKSIEISTSTQFNINSLADVRTFTITTGHQLNLFSGPLYFLYKIISTLNLCKELSQKYPTYNFVPIYWMASEDHDFEEIQYFNFKDQKISWNRGAGGSVGRLSTEGLDKVFQEFSSMLNLGKNAEELRLLFKDSYLKHNNLGDASRYLVNKLFGTNGLVIVDGDDIALKKMFKPYAVKELKEQTSYKEVSKTNIDLNSKGYKIQVNPRETNLFYIGDGFRERIIKKGTSYSINNTSLKFDNAEALFQNTEKGDFVSGNALLRPLYQEVILPNLCYIGGGGELAYWLQLKSTFGAFDVPFPMLLLRNSAVLISEKQQNKIDRLNLDVKDLFLHQTALIRKSVKARSKIDFDFEAKEQQLKQTFDELASLVTLTDPSFIGAVKAQEKKQLKGIKFLEKRLLKSEKKKFKDLLQRVTKLQNELFPNQTLEERQRNFSEYYEAYGTSLIEQLIDELDPLKMKFSVIYLKE